MSDIIIPADSPDSLADFGVTATAAELNHSVGVTSPIQPQLNTKEPANANIQNHIANTSNPHGVTKSQVGLGNVDNTSDANKPVSTATQTALDGKAATTHQHSVTDTTSGIAANRVPHMNSGGTALTSTANFEIDTAGYFKAPQVVAVNGFHVASSTGNSRCIDYSGSTLIFGSQGYNTTNIKAGSTTLLELNGTNNYVDVKGALRIAAWGFVSYVSGSNFRFGGISGHSGPWAGVEFYASGSEVARLTSGGLIIGGTSLDSSAAFKVASTTKGALLAPMTSTQRGLIASPATGLEVFDTTLNSKMVWNGAEWVRLVGSGSGYDLYSVGTTRFSTGVVENVDINPGVGFALKADAGCVQLPDTEAYYLGDKDTDGSWRHIRSGNDLLFQRRESGSWVTKQTISA